MPRLIYGPGAQSPERGRRYRRAKAPGLGFRGETNEMREALAQRVHDVPADGSFGAVSTASLQAGAK